MSKLLYYPKSFLCYFKDPPWFNDQARKTLNKENGSLKKFINNEILLSDYNKEC